jgi:hypothetical protein
MTKTLKDAILSLPDLCATDGKPKTHKVMIYGSNGWVWEAYESEVVAGWHGPDIKCFGLVHGFEEELGYWMMSEIVMSINISTWTEIKEKEVSQ